MFTLLVFLCIVPRCVNLIIILIYYASILSFCSSRGLVGPASLNGNRYVVTRSCPLHPVSSTHTHTGSHVPPLHTRTSPHTHTHIATHSHTPPPHSLTGSSPFLVDSQDLTKENIVKGRVSFPSKTFKNISGKAKDLLTQLLVVNKR